jgi:hypothetical protein
MDRRIRHQFGMRPKANEKKEPLERSTPFRFALLDPAAVSEQTIYQTAQLKMLCSTVDMTADTL